MSILYSPLGQQHQKKITLSKVKLLINGNWTDSKTTQWRQNQNPASQELLSQVPFSTPEETDQAVQAAHKAYTYWREVSPAQRIRILLRFQALIKENLEEIAYTVTLETGKTFEEAKEEVSRGLEAVEYAAGILPLITGETLENASSGIDNYTFQQPIGVCAGITSSNFPAMIPLWIYPLAITAGNTFVLKPSEHAPLTPNRIAELALEAGLPKGVLNVIHGGGETVQLLLDHPLIRALSFAGSSQVGREIFLKGTSLGKRVQALLNGKNHAVILPDANKEKALTAIAGAAFGSSGQRGMALPIAIFVGESKQWIPELVERAQRLKVGPGLDPSSELGPLITPEAKQRIVSLIESGIREGAQLLLDGREVHVAGYEKGNFIGPVLISQVHREMDIYKQEIFGPILLLFESTSLDHAISLVNSDPCGNGCVLFTESGQAARHFQHFVDSGQVGINVPLPSPLPFSSFMGYPRAAQGDVHTYGKQTIQYFIQTKSITTKWFGQEVGAERLVPNLII